MNIIARLGKFFIAQLEIVRHLLAVLVAALWLAMRPSFWPRTVRNVLARQVLFTGFEAVGLMTSIACVVGITIVLQAQVWLAKVGQRQLLGPFLIVLIVREFAPLLANLVIIIRSASAIAAEMANMKLSGEVSVLEAQGLDPLAYLVMPRVVGTAVCALGLALVFALVSLCSGWVFGFAIGVRIRADDFVNQMFGSLGSLNMVNLLCKSTIPAAFTATICCVEGLAVSIGIEEVPRTTSRSLQRCVVCTFLIVAAVSLLTYL